MPKVIKTKADYEAALKEIERLIDVNPQPGTPDAQQLELVTLLAEDYETKAFRRTPPDPIDAILFRMEQQELAPRDLIPYIGSRSKVSEVLGRKRPLTLSMIRALNEGLGIPARVLLQESPPEQSEEAEPDWSQFPIREMAARGWVDNSVEAVKAFFSQVPSFAHGSVHLRRTRRIRSSRSMDSFALAAWTTRVIVRAGQISSLGAYRTGCVNLEFMRQLAKRSAFEHGPIAARDFLAEHGIPVVVEPQLPYTYLDGAAILVFTQRPIVGLSVRHDRLDSFWYTLMHELAHLGLHSGLEVQEFLDDLDLEARNDPEEKEADELASEALIPQLVWQRSPASRLRSAEAAQDLARQLGIHPAIVAGRIRHEWKSFRVLSNLVGHHEVRRQFTDIKWPD
jgi:HTH-type transcriptional regulator/antitoxin HigA